MEIPSEASPVLFDALSVALSVLASPLPSASPPLSSPPPSPTPESAFAPARTIRREVAVMLMSPPLLFKLRYTEASLLSSAMVTPAEIPIAKLPLSEVVASPSPTAPLVIVCWEETVIFPCVVMVPLPDAIVAKALFRASVTEASGTIEMDPAPAALDSVSVLDVCSAVTDRLSGLSPPTNWALEANSALVVFLWVATATDAPMPSVPPLTSGSDAASLLLSSIISANSSSAT